MVDVVQGRYLRDRREHLRRSQRWLSEASGVSVRTIMRAESGSDLSSESLLAICAALGVDAQDVPRQNAPVSTRLSIERSETAPTRVSFTRSLLGASSPRRRWLHFAAAIFVCLVSVKAYDVSLQKRINVAASEMWQFHLQIPMIRYHAHHLELLMATMDQPDLQAAAIRSVRQAVVHNVTIGPCDGAPEMSEEARREFGICVIEGNPIQVSRVKDGSLIAVLGPMSQVLGQGLTAGLRSSPEINVAVRYLFSPGNSNDPARLRWFEPNLSDSEDVPVFPDGGRMEVRIERSGAVKS